MAEPDWDFWLKTKAVHVWEACALSLNIEPESLRYSTTSWMAEPTEDGPFFEKRSFPSESSYKQFYRRLRLVRGYLGDPNHFHLHTIIMGKPGLAEIYLTDFVKWALTVVEWNDLPSRLSKVQGSGSSQSSPTPLPTPAPIGRAKAQDTAILQAIRDRGHNPKKIPKAPIGKGGLKLDLRQQLTEERKDIFISEGTFDDAWKRLRQQGDIDDAE